MRHLRQILLWPLRLIPTREAAGPRRTPWQILRDMGDASPWREALDEYSGDKTRFHERHYNEFVAFLPYVQRFLYGDGRSARNAAGRDASAPMRVFRRHDVKQVRVVARPGDTPVTLEVVHVDLYFFFDVDVVLLNVEVGADHLSLAQAQEQLDRFGRGYPAGWDEHGQALHTMAQVDWLGAQGQVLASSDAQRRNAFLAHVAEHRAPRIAAHWSFLLEPLVADHSGAPGLLAEGDAPLARKVLVFAGVFVATITLTVYTMTKSKGLSDFLDALSDERLSVWMKVKALAAVRRRRSE